MKKLLALICLIAFATCLTAQSWDQWTENSARKVQIEQKEQGILVKIVGEHRWDSEVSHPLGELEPGEYTFMADVQTKYRSFAYLAIKRYKNGKETGRTTSLSNRRSKTHLAVTFIAQKGETVRALVRTAAKKRDIGKEAFFSNFKLIKGRLPQPSRQRFEVVPGYTVASVYVNNLKAAKEEDFKGTVHYRKLGEKTWNPALDLCYIHGCNRAAASIVKLDENTNYEVKLTFTDMGKSETVVHRLTTCGAPVKVTRTLVLSPENWKGSLTPKNDDPNGYLLITAKPGFVVQAAPDAEHAFIIDETQRIILQNMTIKGGKRSAILAVASEDIIIRNCDISGFGYKGTQDFHRKGIYYCNERGYGLNNDAGIHIDGVNRILVENNFIHDPVMTSNSWIHSHPTGPNAIFAGGTASATIRFNDCIGGDFHRWNDAIEGKGNSSLNGSFFRDAEIYGNYLALGDDDGIELDGGQENCRFFYNKCEALLCGISTAPCLTGPSYVFQNLVCDLGDQYYIVNVAMKNNIGCPSRGKVHFFNNTFHTIGSGFSSYGKRDESFPDILKGYGRNNLAHVSGSVLGEQMFTFFRSNFDYTHVSTPNQHNVDRFNKLREKISVEPNAIVKQAEFNDASKHDFTLKPTSPGYGQGVSIPNFLPIDKPNTGAFQPGEPQTLPYRPLPFTASPTKLTFDCKNNVVPAPQQIVLTATKDAPFTVVTTEEAAPYLNITPKKGVVPANGTLTLNVAVIPEKLPAARINRTAFIIRMPNGCSRPISVQIDNSDNAALLAKERKGALHGTAEHLGKTIKLIFNVKEAGDYFLHVRFDEGPTRFTWKRPNETEFTRAIAFTASGKPFPKWCFIGNSTYNGNPTHPVKLEPGTHVFEIQSIRNTTLPNVLDTALAPVPMFINAPWQP